MCGVGLFWLLLLLTVSSVQCIDRRQNEVSVSRLFQVKEGVKVLAKNEGTGCGCVNYTCGCCAHVEVEELKLNDTGCVNVTYLPDQYGISVTLSVDGVVLYNETVSVRNPPPLCVGIPHLAKYGSLCIQFYNLDVKNYTLTGCVRVLARLELVILKRFELGCFKIPPTFKGTGYSKEILLWN